MKHTKLTYLLIISIMVYAFAGTALASEYKIIDTNELKAMIDANRKDFALIDTRTKEEFEEAHIITAINIPEKSFEKLAPSMLSDKSKLLIFYCSGVKCGKSKRTAKIAEKMGYSNLAIYNEGYPVWEERGFKIVPGPSYEAKIETTKIKPEDLKKLIDAGSKDYVLIDVRDASEFKEGHIPTAMNIPANEIASKQDILPKEKKIIVYCNAGSRSYMAYRKLMRMEYKNINQTLFADWQTAKLPISK
ncbi:MAG: rhodanese-like domain-containing protein [Thermodesulfovibrionales bacterium]